MKKMNKKGFTIVELVIVIAVIAILAAVLIPTFTSLINDANESAAMQEATQVHNNLLIEYDADLDFNKGTGADLYITILDEDGAIEYVYSVTNGKLALEENMTAVPDGYAAATINGATVNNAFIYAAQSN